jgi:signal peptidase I
MNEELRVKSIIVGVRKRRQKPRKALAAKRPPDRPSRLAGFVQSTAVTATLALFLTTFSIQAFEVPSGSMENTILVGERLLVDKLAYGPHGSWLAPLLPYRDIRRGDVIIFKFPPDPAIHYVKRVVGLPGERLRLVKGQLQVDGRFLDEGYVVHKIGNRDAFRDEFPSAPADASPVKADPAWAEQLPHHVHGGWLVVPPGRYFVLGDNRDNSLDSRYWGFVPRESIVGRPLVVFWSIKSTSADFAYNSQWEWAAGVAKRIVLFPFRARLNRMFLPVH